MFTLYKLCGSSGSIDGYLISLKVWFMIPPTWLITYYIASIQGNTEDTAIVGSSWTCVYLHLVSANIYLWIIYMLGTSLTSNAA